MRFTSLKSKASSLIKRLKSKCRHLITRRRQREARMARDKALQECLLVTRMKLNTRKVSDPSFIPHYDGIKCLYATPLLNAIEVEFLFGTKFLYYPQKPLTIINYKDLSSLYAKTIVPAYCNISCLFEPPKVQFSVTFNHKYIPFSRYLFQDPAALLAQQVKLELKVQQAATIPYCQTSMRCLFAFQSQNLFQNPLPNVYKHVNATRYLYTIYTMQAIPSVTKQLSLLDLADSILHVAFEDAEIVDEKLLLVSKDKTNGDLCDIDTETILKTGATGILREKNAGELSLANTKKALKKCLVKQVTFDQQVDFTESLLEGDFEKVKQLLALGSSMDYNPLGKERCPLSLAILGGNFEIVKHLIELGANVNSHNYNGRTPLHFAATVWNKEMFEMLLNCPAIEPVDTDGNHNTLIRSVDYSFEDYLEYEQEIEQCLIAYGYSDFKREKVIPRDRVMRELEKLTGLKQKESVVVLSEADKKDIKDAKDVIDTRSDVHSE